MAGRRRIRGGAADPGDAAAVADIPGTGRAIFAATADGTVYEWDLTTGQLLTGWPVPVTPPADLAFGAGSSNAVFGGDYHGRFGWRREAGDSWVTSMNHELTVFLVKDGTVAWRVNNDSADCWRAQW